MTGLTNYSAFNLLNYLTGQQSEPALPATWLALFTVAGSDDGTGFTEVSGGSYARVQVGGTVATSASTGSGTVLTFSAVPAWVTVGMTVFDNTSTGAITAGTTVVSKTGTTVTLSAAVNSAVGSGDSISFSAFGRTSGTGPSTITNVAAVTFAAATANWGTVVCFGLYDASTSGNLQIWDWIGNFQWLPCSITLASPGVFNAKGSAYTNGDSVVFSVEYGGTAPSGITPGDTIQTVAGASGDTFNIGLNTTTTGSGMIRKITQQSIPSGITATFPASSMTATAA